MTTHPLKLYFIGLLIGLVGAGILIGVAQFIKKPTAKSFTIDKTKFSSWQTVTTKTGLVTAKFPLAPTRQETTIPITDSTFSISQETYTSQDENGISFFLSTASYPQPFDPQKAEVILQTSLDGLIGAAQGNKLVTSSFSLFKTMPSVEFVIQNDSSYYQGKLFLKDNVLFQAFVAYAEGALESDDYVYFLDSIVPKLP